MSFGHLTTPRNDIKDFMNTLLLEHFDQLISTPEDVEKLNAAIVHLALQGSLVSQDSGDEPAIELLKKVVRTNRKNPVVDIRTLQLPKNWSAEYLGEIAEQITKGSTPTTYGFQFQSEGIRFIKVENVKNGRIVVEGIKDFISEEANQAQARSQLQAGDILFSIAGTIGETCVVKSEDLPANTNQALAIIRGTQFVFDPKFLKLQLDSFVANAIKDRARGGAMNNVSLGDLRQLLVFIPPLAEQQRIVARVEELFAQTRLLAEQLTGARTELDHLNESALAHLLASETSEEFNERWEFIAEHFDLLTSAPEHIAPLRQSILELAVSGKLTRREPSDEPAKELLKRIKAEKEKIGITQPSIPVRDEEKTFDLPKGWEWVRWDDVSLQIADVDHKMPGEVEDGIPYVSPRDFKGKEEIAFSTAKKISRKDYDDLASKIRPERGDIIFPRYGTIGVNRFVSVDFEFLASYSCAIVKHMKGLMNPRYVYFYSLSPFLKQETQKYINKTTQANVGIKSIQKFLFPLPPLAEQERIVKRVEQLLGWCDTLEAQLKSAEEERRRLVESVLARVGG
jgi:type I restriction enzyme S subunit